jgi:hypothetical protein
MESFFTSVAIAVSVSFPICFFVFAVLWRLRSRGAYTLLLCVFFVAVFMRVGFAVAPHAMMYHDKEGTTPYGEGVALGCMMPILPMVLYHLGQRNQPKKP